MKKDFLGQIFGLNIKENLKKRIIINDDNSLNSKDEIKFTNDIKFSDKKYSLIITNNANINKDFKGIILNENIIENFLEYDIIELIPFKNNKVIVKRIFKSDSEDNILFLTNKCNSNCLFCPDSNELRKNTKEYIKESIDLIHLLPQSVKHIGITGGEPTILKDNFFKILEECKMNLPSINYTIITNGRMFYYKDFCKRYKECHPYNTKVAIALHHYNDIEHDKITQVKGSFKQTFLGIKNLLSLNERVEIRIVLNKTNYKFLNKMANLIGENFKNVEEVNILSLELLGNAGQNYENFWINKEEINSALELALPIFIKNRIKVNLYNFPLCLLKSEFWNITKRSITDYKSKYGENCQDCLVYNKCDGFFFSTFNIIKPKIEPIK